MQKQKDWIALIEAGYSLEQDDEGWLQHILAKAAPLFDRGHWPSTWTFTYSPTTAEVQHMVSRAPSALIKIIRDSTQEVPEAVDILYRSGRIIGTMSCAVFSRLPEQRKIYRRRTLGLFHDNLGIAAHTGSGSGLMLTCALPFETTPNYLERSRWPLAASHLAAGLRLRSFAKMQTMDCESVEAILSPDGRLHDARSCAKVTGIRDFLRCKVRQLDRLRTRDGRSDSETTMRAWEGLVCGRWSLVDKFDSDNRRYVLAIKNDPVTPDPRGLTPRERQVAEYVGLGHSSKQISYTLGISSSSVTNCTARAQLKLGLRSRTELSAFFSPGGARAKLVEHSLAGEKLLVGAYPLFAEDVVKRLTEAEQSILALLLQGSTNNDIADRRHTSERTVANQVQSIFRKLGVKSRSELAHRLQSAK